MGRDMTYIEENAYVSQMTQSGVERALGVMPQVLEDAPIVLCVEAAGDCENIFYSSVQKCIVREIFKGEGVYEGEIIYLTYLEWDLWLQGDFDCNRFDNSMFQRKYVNVMEVGRDYLVFVSEISPAIYKGARVAVLPKDEIGFAFPPLFCYDDIPNVFSGNYLKPGSSYVPYKEVKDNEFFGDSEETLNALVSYKKEVLAMYSQGDIHRK